MHNRKSSVKEMINQIHQFIIENNKEEAIRYFNQHREVIFSSDDYEALMGITLEIIQVYGLAQKYILQNLREGIELHIYACQKFEKIDIIKDESLYYKYKSYIYKYAEHEERFWTMLHNMLEDAVQSSHSKRTIIKLSEYIDFAIFRAKDSLVKRELTLNNLYHYKRQLQVLLHSAESSQSNQIAANRPNKRKESEDHENNVQADNQPHSKKTKTTNDHQITPIKIRVNLLRALATQQPESRSEIEVNRPDERKVVEVEAPKPSIVTVLRDTHNHRFNTTNIATHRCPKQLKVGFCDKQYVEKKMPKSMRTFPRSAMKYTDSHSNKSGLFVGSAQQNITSQSDTSQSAPGFEFIWGNRGWSRDEAAQLLRALARYCEYGFKKHRESTNSDQGFTVIITAYHLYEQAIAWGDTRDAVKFKALLKQCYEKDLKKFIGNNMHFGEPQLPAKFSIEYFKARVRDTVAELDCHFGKEETRKQLLGYLSNKNGPVLTDALATFYHMQYDAYQMGNDEEYLSQILAEMNQRP